jgi:hypothetical protein
MAEKIQWIAFNKDSNICRSKGAIDGFHGVTLRRRWRKKKKSKKARR